MDKPVAEGGGARGHGKIFVWEPIILRGTLMKKGDFGGLPPPPWDLPGPGSGDETGSLREDVSLSLPELEIGEELSVVADAELGDLLVLEEFLSRDKIDGTLELVCGLLSSLQQALVEEVHASDKRYHHHLHLEFLVSETPDTYR